MFLKSALDKVKQIFNFLGVSALGSLKQSALNYLKRRSKKIVWCQKKEKKRIEVLTNHRIIYGGGRTYKMINPEQLDFMTDLLISLESPTRFFQLIRMGHSDNSGESYSRFDVIWEIQRRYREIFQALGWSLSPDSVYKNRYTADESSLYEMYLNHSSSMPQARRTGGTQTRTNKAHG